MKLLYFTKLSKKSISKELEEYVKGIEEETGRIAYIKNLQNLGGPGQFARFILNNSFQISVEIVEDNFLDSKGELCKEEIECMIAHEVTHGLLAYKKNYCQHNLILDDSELGGRSADKLFTMIEDIVVNKMIDENNLFQPLIKSYIDTVMEREVKLLRRDEDCYKIGNNSPIFRDRFMVWRYIQAWGFLKYFNLDNESKKVINEYLEKFQNKYPQQYEQAIKTRDIIKDNNNNIFTAEGFYNAIEKCLDLKVWNIPDIKIITTLQALQLL